MQMDKRIRFGRWEAIMLITNLICTKVFLYFNRMTAEDTGNAGWMMAAFTSAMALLFYFLVMSLYGKFEGMDILDIAEAGGGKVLRTITGFVLGGALFVLAAITMRKFSEDIKTISLPTSPLSYVMGFFMAGVIIAGLLGVESIVRHNAIVTPIATAGYIVILLGIMPNIDVTNLLPILGTGLKDILMKGFYRTSVFAELLVLFMLPPFLENPGDARKVGYVAITASAFFFVTGSLVYTLVFPYPTSMEPFLPVFNMARLIGLGRFFQRIESLFVFIWVMSALVYLSTVFYFGVYTVSKAAGLKYARPMMIPFAIILFSAAFLPVDLLSVIKIESEIINTWGWAVTFAFIGLVMIAAGAGKRAGRGTKGR